MRTIIPAVLASMLLVAATKTANAQIAARDSAAADSAIVVPVDTVAPVEDSVVAIPVDSTPPTPELAGPYRTDVPPQAAPPCVRQVRRVPPPPSPRSFRRQWPLAAVGAIAGWFVGDRIVGPKGNPLVILSASTVGAVAGSHVQAAGEGHANLGRSLLGGVLGALPAGAILYLNQMDTYDEADYLTRGVVPVLGGAVQAAVTAGATSSSLQPARIQIIECPHPAPTAVPPATP